MCKRANMMVPSWSRQERFPSALMDDWSRAAIKRPSPYKASNKKHAHWGSMGSRDTRQRRRKEVCLLSVVISRTIFICLCKKFEVTSSYVWPLYFAEISWMKTLNLFWYNFLYKDITLFFPLKREKTCIIHSFLQQPRILNGRKCHQWNVKKKKKI